MRNPALFIATILVLGATACTPETPLQSGGSGMSEESSVGGIRTSRGCFSDDYNCQSLYDYPGGGD
jgi:hypothetical protein